MIDNIFNLCNTISKEMTSKNYTNAYNEFVNMLNLIISLEIKK